MEEKYEKNNEKVQSLRDMIYSMEKTLQGAKSMLLQLENKKKVGRRKKLSDEDATGSQIIEGTFDGQIMVGNNAKQYPVPANYASKSKLVEGDVLKLTITEDGSFIYKQIGPAERKIVIGVVSLDSDGNYFVAAEGKAYKVLLASITYFKVEPGDEVTLVTPKDMNSDWGSIENVLRKGQEQKGVNLSPERSHDFNIDDILKDEKPENKVSEIEEQPQKKAFVQNSIEDEWAPDLEELRKELEKTD